MAIRLAGAGIRTRNSWIQNCTAWDSLTLAGVCLADMLSTLYWLHSGAAREANPVMAHSLQNGYGAFCAQKLASFLPLILFCAYYRSRRPRLVAIALRGTTVLYILFYIVGVWLATYY